MKRRGLLKLAGFLLLGAAVNVAVAWVCYLTIDPSGGKISSVSGYRWPPPPTWLETKVTRKSGRDRVEVVRWTYHGRWLADENGTPPTRQTIEVKQRAGFPLAALELHVQDPAATAIDRRLPLQPVWFGFAVNSMLYYVLLAIAWFLPVLREISRSNRGLCPACAYPVGASEVCTECGKPVRAARGR